jgi:peptidoglycan/LPS O-acetylase OafA/YrhL
VANFVPGQALKPIGPWWFMPFILQFYLVWSLIRRAVNRFGVHALALLSLTCVGLVYGLNPGLVSRWNINLMYCPVGHMPEICLGIAAARHRFFPGTVLLACSSVTFMLSNLYYGWWALSYSSVLLIMLWSYRHLGVLRGSRILVYLGRRSLEIFLVNGFTRHPFVIRAAAGFTGLVLGLVSLVMAIAVAELLAQLSSRLARMSLLRRGATFDI